MLEWNYHLIVLFVNISTNCQQTKISLLLILINIIVKSSTLKYSWCAWSFEITSPFEYFSWNYHLDLIWVYVFWENFSTSFIKCLTFPDKSGRIFYNRVPKCGSRTFIAVYKELSRLNRFGFKSSRIFRSSYLPHFPDQVSIQWNTRLESLMLHMILGN